MPIDYDERRFTSVSNSAAGDVGSGTLFHYRQRGDVVWGTYEGGGIAVGTLIARVSTDGSLDMRYQHVTPDGVIKTGRCLSQPEILVDGRIRLHERWQWTEGSTAAGESIVEEVAPDGANY